VRRAERPDSLDVLRANVQPPLLELRQRAFSVARVPKDDGVDDQTQRPKLVFLPLAIALPQFTALAVEDCVGEAMPPLTAVELKQDAPTIAFVVNVSQQSVLAMRPSSAMARTRVEVRLPLREVTSGSAASIRRS